MKASDLIPKVEDVAIAIVPEIVEDEQGWMVYIVNLKNKILKNVLITSQGYGQINDQPLKTSTLRHFIEEVPAHGYHKVEPIMEDVFGLNNEFWVSFYLDSTILDKKFIFLSETITENNFVTIPLINKKGVMIK